MTAQLKTQTLERSADPEDIGLSTAALERMEQRLGRDVDEGAIHGFVAAVARAGSVAWLCARGTRDGIEPMHALVAEEAGRRRRARKSRRGRAPSPPRSAAAPTDTETRGSR